MLQGHVKFVTSFLTRRGSERSNASPARQLLSSLRVEHPFDVQLIETGRFIPVDEASTPQADFDRDGAVQRWNSSFAAKFAPLKIEPGRPISDFFPVIGGQTWTIIWQKIEAQRSVAFRLCCPPDSSEATDIFVQQSMSEGDDLNAAIEIYRQSEAMNRQLLQQMQHDILEAVATGCLLHEVIDLMCRRVEALTPGVICSVFTVDAENRLWTLAAPSLPKDYTSAIDGMLIGPCVGCCGTAAYRGEPVGSSDIAIDPSWDRFREAALALGLRACWSSPIKGRNGKVAGTFAFYYRSPRGPSALDRQIVEACVHLCAIAIEHDGAQSRIMKLAFHDQLTGLPNRMAFQRRASEILSLLPVPGHSLAVHYIDLDDFKGVNDTLGHWVGDLLLQAVSKRFASICDQSEFIARLGGDEFAVLQFPVRSMSEIDQLAARILLCFARPFEIEDRKISINASIGISQAPADSSNFVELLKRADVALYHAKSTGRATHRCFTEEMDRKILARRAIERDLRDAVDNSRITLSFQPIVNLGNGTINCFEALARWTHPTRGSVPPSEFIRLAEEMGIIGTLGDWILREACATAAAWPANIKVSVNLSPLQLTRPAFAADVAAALAASRLAPARLELEITESVPLVENGAMREVLNDLKRLGIGIALDDFGTGYSSLSYLRSFPFDRIKIDLSFIHEMQQHEESMSIVRAVLGLARSLGVRTTAEGIETERQRMWLQAQGCTEGQGYLFGKPIAKNEIQPLLAGQRGKTQSSRSFKRA